MGRKTVEFTIEERQKIQILKSKGKSGSEIALLLGRSKNGINTEIRRGEGYNYNAHHSHNLYLQRKEEKYAKLSERNNGNKVTFKMKQRIENLEMQVEILHDTLKELLKK